MLKHGAIVKIMISSSYLSMILLGTVVNLAILAPQTIASLSPVEINQRAKQFTVKIDGQESGSGALISRQGNLYTVLTNWHVVDSEGRYTVQTEDGQTHTINQKIHLTGADLAVIYFSSPKTYTVAKKGNSEQLVEGQTIHFAGYPSPQQVARNRTYQFYSSQNIIGFLSFADIREGYEIIFSGAALPGMSGSPILDNNASLIGIYGRVETNLNTSQPTLYGIRLNTAIGIAQKAGIDLGDTTTVKTPPPLSLPRRDSPKPSRPPVIVPSTSPGNTICPGHRC